MTPGSGDDLEVLLDGIWARRRQELCGRVEELRSALEQADWSAATAEAHRLTGALGSLGFDTAAHDARHVERATADGPPADADEVRRLVDGIADAVGSATTRPRG